MKCQVPEYTLQDMYDALGLDQCVTAGNLHEDAAYEQLTGARMCSDPAAISYFRRLRTAHGRSVARLHYVECPYSGIIGRWVSAIQVGDVTFYRVGHQPRPQ